MGKRTSKLVYSLLGGFLPHHLKGAEAAIFKKGGYMTYLSKLIPMVLMTGFALAAYGNQTSPSRSSNFELIILHQNWFELQIGYDAEPAQITLKSLTRMNRFLR